MRNILLTLTIGTLALVLGACGKETKGPLEDGVLTVGMECAYAPYNWTTTTESDTSHPIAGTNQYCDGYDVQMAKTIAEELDVDLEIKSLDWTGLIPALQTNQIDAIIAGMSPTSKRKLTIDFTEAYYRSADTTEQTVIVLADGNYKDATSLDGFNGANIAAQLGTLQDEEGLIEQMTGANHATALDDYPTLVAALEAGTINGFIAEYPVATQITNNNTDLKMIVFADGEGFTLNEAFTSTSIGIRKSDTDLKSKLNKVLEDVSDEQRTTWMNDFINKSSNNE